MDQTKGFAGSSNTSGTKNLLNESEQAEGSANSNITASTALTPQIPSSQGSPNHKAETIWTLPTLQRDQFFAAAFYLSVQQPTQRRQPSKNRPNNRELVATPAQEKFLDLIALLFARVKGAPLHVTATALKVTANHYEIYVVKNGGPDEDDENLADKLTLWFAKKPDNATNKNMRVEMAIFWESRLELYWGRVRSDWEKKFKSRKLERMTLESKNLETTKGPVAQLINQYREAKLDMEKFVDDWNDVQSLMATLMPLDSPDFNAMDKTALAKFESLERQKYPKLVGEGLKVHFRKLIKRIKLLATIPLLLKACHDFRKFIEEKSVKFVLPEGPDSDFLLDSVPIINALDSWVVPKAFESSEAFEREKILAQDEIENLSDENQQIRRFFHCELQLLDMFLTADDVYDYFGCSKLSCFMCWGVLEGSPYRTRWTHAKVYPACAFPFDLSTGVRHYRLALALKKVQDRLLGRVLRRVVDDPDVSGKPFSTHPGITETDPGAQPDYESLEPSKLQSLKDEHQESRKRPIPVSHSKTMSRQAIKIPCSGSTPELVPVTLIDKYGSGDRHQHIQYSSNPKELWVSQMQLDNEGPDYGDMLYWVVSPVSFSSSPDRLIYTLHRLRDNIVEYLPVNEWCANIAKSSGPPINTQANKFPWRDDVYLFLIEADYGRPDRVVLPPIYDDMLREFREYYFERPDREEINRQVLMRLLRLNNDASE